LGSQGFYKYSTQNTNKEIAKPIKKGVEKQAVILAKYSVLRFNFRTTETNFVSLKVAEN
jgi:hypothetical protein